jgi:hypothetical protein
MEKSKSESNCTINISLKNDKVFPGDNIEGDININVRSPIEVKSLKVLLELEENWVNSQGEYHYDENRRSILMEVLVNIDHSLTHMAGYKILKIGAYSFPFTLSLSKNMIPSFEYNLRMIYTTHSYVRYKVKTFLELITDDDISSEKILIINSLTDENISTGTSTSSSICQKVRAWLFFNKGQVTLNAISTKKIFKFGDSIILSILINNKDCSLNITQVKLVLVQKIFLKKLDNLWKFDFQNSINEKLIKIIIDPGKVLTIDTEFELKNTQIQKDLYNNSDDLNTITGIWNSQPSLNSGLIQCEYFIKISLDFNSFVSYDNKPRIMLPIIISNININNNDSIQYDINSINTDHHFEDINNCNDYNQEAIEMLLKKTN